MLTIIYARNHSPLSVLLRAADRWGQWSHCGIVDGDHVLEARWWRGFVRTPFPAFLGRYSRTEQVEVECPRAWEAIAWAREQLGKPYDWRSLLGNLLRNSWQNEGAHQCAEFVEAALVEAGRPRFREAA